MALAGITPTTRTAAILAAIALASLVIPIGIAVAGVIVLIAAWATDGWIVREPPGIERKLESVLSRGVAAPLRVRVATRDDRRVLLRQPATAALAIDGSTGAGELDGQLIPRLRGKHRLPAVASASVGALGLARVHHRSGEAITVRVYPDLVAARGLIARLRRQLAAHPGRLSRGPLGLGTDFESVREYSPDDDIRQLNWLASARTGRPMSNQYRLERDRDLICLIDAGRLMAAPLGSRTMLDAALDAVTVLALAADELGDRCGAVAFDHEIRRLVGPRHLSGRRVIESLFDLQARLVDSDFEAAFTRIGRSRRALVVVFTDLIDEAAARSLTRAVGMLAGRHAIAVASATDPMLDRALSPVSGAPHDVASAVVARDVLDARAHAVTRLRRAGASVIEAPAQQLAARSLDAYLRAKALARV
jgi:uncharacterized protein (DUF58 family)